MFSNLEKNENYQNSNYEDKDKIEDQYQDVDPVVQSCPHAADRRKPHRFPTSHNSAVQKPGDYGDSWKVIA